MSFLTLVMGSPQLLSKIEASKNQDWLGGLAYVLVAKLMRKYKPDNTLAVAEQTKKLMSLKLKKNKDPETLGDAIAVLETGYGCTILESQKVAAIVNAAGGQYVDSIQHTKNKFPASDKVDFDPSNNGDSSLMKEKVTNNSAMSFLTLAMDLPQLLSKIEASKSQDWPGGLAYVLVQS